MSPRRRSDPEEKDVKPQKRKQTFEEVLEKKKDGKYVLRLYVAGLTPRSQSAIKNIRIICREHLQGRYDLEVIDIFRQPALAQGQQIIAAPTLIKKLPLPLRRFIGDLSDTERIMVGLDLRSKNK